MINTCKGKNMKQDGLQKLTKCVLNKEQEQLNLLDFILPTDLKNSDLDQKFKDVEFNTRDYIFLDSSEEIESLPQRLRVTPLSDYAEHNGAYPYSSEYLNNMRGKMPLAHCWLRSYSTGKIMTGPHSDDGEEVDSRYTYNNSIAVAPSMHLDLQKIISMREKNPNFGKIAPVRSVTGRVLYYTIEFGSYPQTWAKKLDGKLEELEEKGKLKPTGKKYTGHLQLDGKYSNVTEYKYNGRLYVSCDLLPSVKRRASQMYIDDSMRKLYENYCRWYRVEPIRWRIINWDEMPTEINPNGNGKAKYIFVRADKAIIGGLPFGHIMKDLEKQRRVFPDPLCGFWQNSILRGYLNGINAYNYLHNGNGKLLMQNPLADFSQQGGFMQEAFNISPELIKTNYRKFNIEMIDGQAYPFGFDPDEVNYEI